MSAMDAKQGRGRRYCWPATPGFASPELAAMVGGLDELLARQRDLLEDLPGKALQFVPPGLGNHLAGLTRHMAWAECHWLSQLAQIAPAAELDAALVSDAVDDSAHQLLALCVRVRHEVAKPVLAPLVEVEREVTTPDGRVLTPRGVVQHLLWHWTYHGGQCGLLRRLSGHPYRWSFDPCAFQG